MLLVSFYIYVLNRDAPLMDTLISDIHVCLRINCYNFVVPLTPYIAVSSGQKVYPVLLVAELLIDTSFDSLGTSMHALWPATANK